MGMFTPFWEKQPEWMLKGHFEKQIQIIFNATLRDYISLTGFIEIQLNEAIASFYFIKPKDKNYLIKHLILNQQFSKKITILRNLLSQKAYKKPCSFDNTLDHLEKLLETRNKLAHSTFWINDKFINKCVQNKKVVKISFKNLRWTPQPMYLSLEQIFTDRQRMLLMIKSFNQLIKQIETIRGLNEVGQTEQLIHYERKRKS